MKVEFEVKRYRQSVTQGMVDILINGEKVMDFGDKIEMIQDGEKYYGEKIGNWASKIPDTKFIIATLYHTCDNIYHYSDKVKEKLNAIMQSE